MKFDYQNVWQLMKAYRSLTKQEAMIMEYLWNNGAEITYSKLAKELNIDASNIRKALLHMEEIGIICIVRKYNKKEHKKNNSMTACFIVDGWMDNLLTA